MPYRSSSQRARETGHLVYQVLDASAKALQNVQARGVVAVAATYGRVMSHVNQSCLIWMSHVIHGWIMLHIHNACQIWMSHVTYEWVMTRMNKPLHIWMSHVSYKWIMSRIQESCHIELSHITSGTYESVMSHTHTHTHRHKETARLKKTETSKEGGCVRGWGQGWGRGRFFFNNKKQTSAGVQFALALNRG